MNTTEKMEFARRFPYNTCPASRHAQLLAESMLASTKPRWSIDEPNYCGESIAFVVTWLYQARDRIEALEAENAKLRATCEEVEQKRNTQEHAEGWVMVPVEPTEKMITAIYGGGMANLSEFDLRRIRTQAKLDWAGILAATPSAPTAIEPDKQSTVVEPERCIDKWGNVAAKAGDFVESEDLAFHILDVHQNGLCSVDPSKPMVIKNDTKMTRLAVAGALAVMASRLTFATSSAPTAIEPAAQPGSVWEWKDHDTAKLVNELRDIAVTYAGAQQLRERIAHAVRPLTDKLEAQKGTT